MTNKVHPSEKIKIKTTWKLTGSSRIYIRVIAILEKPTGDGWNIQIKDDVLQTKLIDSEEFLNKYHFMAKMSEPSFVEEVEQIAPKFFSPD